MKNIDQKLIKKSNTRLIISGNELEFITYERPYFYNFAPSLRSRGNDGHSVTSDPFSDENVGLEERRIDHLQRTRSHLRRLISANASAWNCMPLFLTYTFANNIQNVKEANHLFDVFNKRLKRRLGISMKYVVVMEFQKRGAIHYHAIYFNIPYIAGLRKIISDTWQHGFINVQSVRHVRSLGAYIAKYMQVDLNDKRLCGKKAFFTSKKLIQPIEYRNEETIAKFMKDVIVKKEVRKIKFDSVKFGAITYEQYKTK